MQNSQRWRLIKQSAQSQLIVIGGFIALIWLLEVVDAFVLRGSLDGLGIRPRSLDGLRGILFAPLLHGGFGHLIANTIPLAVLSWLVLTTRRLANFVAISLIILVVAGLGTWLVAPRASLHIGASGLIFGYFGFLLAIAYFERSIQSFVLAIVVIIFYGSMIFGVFPRGGGISWQSHLFGLIGGGAAAFVTGRRQTMLSPQPVEDQITIIEQSTRDR